jgi:hypothetical protein
LKSFSGGKNIKQNTLRIAPFRVTDIIALREWRGDNKGSGACSPHPSQKRTNDKIYRKQMEGLKQAGQKEPDIALWLLGH